ncbi:M23 family metallopeptidase [Kitasatospora aureofaciens]|uniref:M23 family metallopeptidase n=1 Tax=Kitasatospora aureofaciens TaxID=1894 RepID=UPI001C46A8FC|nr:M23 family metallopeptidase [Kitasatospora aureofaciens]MBV6701841.1 M23 family metallopeptidase [Kitasatospora aureofaciens]
MTARAGVRGMLAVVLLVALALSGASGAARAAGDARTAGASGLPFGGGGGASGAVGGRGRAWPVGGPGGVLGRFEPPAKPWAAGHRGVDLAAAVGEEVRAAAPGVVTFAGLVAGRPVVTVTHPDSGASPLRTTYLPVTGSVPVGSVVAAGQVIGRLAPDGRHCTGRDCLHWGLLRGGRYLDPLALFGVGSARLLPLGGPERPGRPRRSGPAG